MSGSPETSRNTATVWGAIQKKNRRLPSSHMIQIETSQEDDIPWRESSQPDSEMMMGMTRLEQLEARFDPEAKINLQSDASGRERYFLRVGFLQKFTRSKWQRYVFVLFSNSLIWCSENSKRMLSRQGEMLLRNQKCFKVRDRDFFIEGPHSFTCTASSRDERDEWVAAINSVLHAKHPIVAPRDVIVFQGSVTKIRKSSKHTLQYVMLYINGNLAWGNDRSTICKEAKIVDVVTFDRLLSEPNVTVPDRARNRFLAVFSSKKTTPSMILFATQQQREIWLSWWNAKQRVQNRSEPEVASSLEVKEPEDVNATTRMFKLLMAGDCNGLGSPCLPIIKEGGAVEISLLLPVLACMIAVTPFWIRSQCAPLVEAIKERAFYDLEIAQAMYACYHCGFLEAHPHNSLAYGSWGNDLPRRGDICTALKHMYQRPIGFEFYLENTMEAYHPFRGNRIRRVVLEQILDESSDVLVSKGLIACYCYREESEVKKRERHERKATRIFAQGGRALSPDALLADNPVQDGFRTVSIILKIGGHLRRDVAYVHIARMMNMLWEQEKMEIDGQPIQISTFGAVAFTSHIGVIQFMPEMIPMRDVRSAFFPAERAQWRTDVEMNLMCSAIGTYLATTILSLSERNEANVVIQPDGTVMVGELGPRLLETCDSPESFGITQDFKAVLGDENWEIFVDVLIDSFAALRKHIGTLVQFCTMMLNSVTPTNQVAESLQSGFMMDLDTGAACAMLRKRSERLLVSKSVTKLVTSPQAPVATAPPAETLVNGNSALMVASEQGNEEVVESLLGKKADPNQANEDGRTPLMLASESGRDKVVRLLIQKKADVNQLNKDSGSALILASQAGQWAIVRALLDAKADPKQTDKFEENAMYWAHSFDESSIMALLESLGVESVS